MKINLVSQHHNTLGYLGSVTDVIAGKINPSLKNKIFHAEDYAYGFEIGTPKDWESLGDTILVNNHLYTQSTDQQSSDFGKVISGEEFKSSGLFLIPHRAEPNAEFSYSSDSRTDLNSDLFLDFSQFQQELYQKIQEPFAFIAQVLFKNLHANAISKPPIHAQNIFENTADYFKISPWDLKNQHAFIMGVVTNFEDQKLKNINQALSAALYHNPFEHHQEHKQETQSQSKNIIPLSSHTHGLCLKQCVSHPQDIVPSLAERVVHIFSENSSIQKIQGQVFIISQMQDLNS